MPQGPVRRTGDIRKERFQDGVGLRLQGGPDRGRPGGSYRLRPGPRKLRREAYLADKGFSSPSWEERWPERYGALVAATPQKTSRRAWTEEDGCWAAGKRQILEEVIDQLKDLFGLESHRAKTLDGLLARTAAKVAAYTCGQILNMLLERPLRRLACLLV